jgi:hypothetical protein
MLWRLVGVLAHAVIVVALRGPGAVGCVTRGARAARGQKPMPWRWPIFVAVVLILIAKNLGGTSSIIEDAAFPRTDGRTVSHAIEIGWPLTVYGAYFELPSSFLEFQPRSTAYYVSRTIIDFALSIVLAVAATKCLSAYCASGFLTIRGMLIAIATLATLIAIALPLFQPDGRYGAIRHVVGQCVDSLALLFIVFAWCCAFDIADALWPRNSTNHVMHD